MFVVHRKSLYPRVCLLWSLIAAFSTIARADSLIPPRARAVVSENGRFLLINVPTIPPKKGVNTCYQVLEDGELKQLWSTDEEIDGQLYLSDDGQGLVRVVGCPQGNAARPEDVGIEFYLNGKRLSRFSPFTLVKDHSLIVATVSRYCWMDPSGEYRGFTGVPVTFRLTTVDGVVCFFDYITGQLIEQRLPKKKRTREDILKWMKLL